jgi:pimeloyl-ACP methyl ester carboxylesterase
VAIVVLVHGTTAGGWVWRKIAPRLREEGHEVYTPTLTGLGDRVHLASPSVDLDTHVTDVVNTVEFAELASVILVGHSYGGMVITGAADRLPGRVAGLVYLDATVPRDGESLVDLMPAERRAETARRVEAEGQGWLIPLLGGANEGTGLNRPHPYRTWTQPVRVATAAALAAIPAAYVVCTADKQPGGSFHRAMNVSLERARSAGWPIYEVGTVHQIVPDPEPKAEVLVRILREHFG